AGIGRSDDRSPGERPVERNQGRRPVEAIRLGARDPSRLVPPEPRDQPVALAARLDLEGLFAIRLLKGFSSDLGIRRVVVAQEPQLDGRAENEKDGKGEGDGGDRAPPHRVAPRGLYPPQRARRPRASIWTKGPCAPLPG